MGKLDTSQKSHQKIIVLKNAIRIFLYKGNSCRQKSNSPHLREFRTPTSSSQGNIAEGSATVPHLREPSAYARPCVCLSVSVCLCVSVCVCWQTATCGKLASGNQADCHVCLLCQPGKFGKVLPLANRLALPFDTCGKQFAAVACVGPNCLEFTVSGN
jgi:hypothetical protein